MRGKRLSAHVFQRRRLARTMAVAISVRLSVPHARDDCDGACGASVARARLTPVAADAGRA